MAYSATDSGAGAADRFLGGSERRRRSHMQEQAFEQKAKEAPVFLCAIEVRHERKGAFWRAVEKSGRKDCSACVDEGSFAGAHVTPQLTRRVHKVIAVSVIADGRFYCREQKQRIHALLVEGLGEPQQVGGFFEPKTVGVEQEERRAAERGKRLGDAAAGAEQLRAFVG